LYNFDDMKTLIYYIAVILLSVLPVLSGCKDSSEVMLAPPSEPPEKLKIPSAFADDSIEPVASDDEALTITTEGAAEITIEAPGTSSSADTPEEETSSALFHVCRQGDTVKSVADRHGVEAAALAALNGMSASSSLKPGRVLVMPRDFSTINMSSEVTTYTVVSGDTYSRIARHFKISPGALMKINNAKDSSLQIGDVLYVPKR
jgi:LysM repeat protein